MLFRIWFQYACKLALLAFFAVIVSTLPWQPAWMPVVRQVATAIVMVLGTCGAIFGIAVFIFHWRPACPLCGEPGDLLQVSKWDSGLECARCGLVHIHMLKHFRLRVEPPGAV